MVGGDVGGGHQHGGLCDGGQLRDGRGARPAQHQIGGGHHQGHVVDILPHLDAVVPQLQPPAQQFLLHPGKIPARAVDVPPGRALVALLGDKVHHLLVHDLRPQGPPVGQQQGPVVRKAQLLPGLLPAVPEKVPSDGGAGDHHLIRAVVVLPALLKAHHHPVHHPGQGLGGQAGDGVGLVDGGGNPPPGRLVDHGEGGVPPGAHHQVGLELVQNGPGLFFGPLHVHQGAQIVGNVGGGKGAVEIGNGDGADLIPLLGHQLVLHPPVRPHEEDAAAGVSLLEDAGQGHRRIHMAGGAAAGKQNVHNYTSSFNLFWVPVSDVKCSKPSQSPPAESSGRCLRS